MEGAPDDSGFVGAVETAEGMVPPGFWAAVAGLAGPAALDWFPEFLEQPVTAIAATIANGTANAIFIGDSLGMMPTCGAIVVYPICTNAERRSGQKCAQAEIFGTSRPARNNGQ